MMLSELHRKNARPRTPRSIQGCVGVQAEGLVGAHAGVHSQEVKPVVGQPRNWMAGGAAAGVR